MTCASWISVAEAATANLVPYSPAKVELAGEVVLDRYSSPRPFDAPALRLQKPISLKGGSGDFNTHSFSQITLVQLVGAEWKKLCGRTVTLIGTLDEPDTTNFDTQVIMTVDRVASQSDAKNCAKLDHTRAR